MDIMKYSTNIFGSSHFPEIEKLTCPHFDFGARKALMASDYFGEMKQKH